MPQQQADDQYVVGVDYGTLSGRAVVVRVRDGAELGTAVHAYPHAVLEAGLPASLAGRDLSLPPEWALQVPEDYREVLRVAVPAAVAAAGVDPSQVVGIATDFTACTMVPTLADGTPLNEVDGLADRPHAYVKLWKHHAAQGQADRINELARTRGEAWLPRYGGLISSEWEFAKGLQLFEEDGDVYDRMVHWVEAADWIVWQLCGSYVRNACTAGYKGILQDGAYPSPEFLEALAPGFGPFVADKLDHRIGELGDRAGGLSAEAAAWTGLPEGIAVAVGNVDAHVTAPAAQAVAPGQMVAIMGTSTCHVMNADVLREVPGMCGVVDGGIVSGLWGYEAGQSGVGDIFGWFTQHGVPPSHVAGGSGRGRVGARAPHPPGRSSGDRRARARRPRLALRQPLGPRRPRAVGRRPGPHPGHPAGGDLPGPAGGHRLRHPRDRGDVPRQRRPGRGVHRGRRAGQERPAHADLRRRDPAAAVDHRLRAGAGARARRSTPRSPPAPTPTCRPPPSRWARCDATSTCPTRAGQRRTTQLFEHYLALHDHFGRATTTMRRLKAIRRDAVARRT